MDKNVLTYLKNKQPKLCVLATASKEGKPQSAVVGYAIEDSGLILISTKKTTRKVKNIRENKHVALIIGWSFEEPNVQYEGEAEIIDKDHTEYQKCEKFFFTMNPRAKVFQTDQTILIRIAPRWLRYLDPTVTPPHIEEFDLS